MSRYVPVPTTNFPGVSVQLSEKQMARFKQRVERWQGAPLAKRASMGTVKAGDYMAAVMKKPGYAPRSSRRTKGKTGTLRRSIKARKGKRGLFTDSYVGPTAPHSFLVTRGTNERYLKGSKPFAVLPGRASAGETTKRGSLLGGVNVRPAPGMPTGQMPPNPFVDRANRDHHGNAIRIINQILFSEA